MPQQISITEVAGESKSRLFKKGFFLLGVLPAVGFMLAGSGYLAHSLFEYWFCYNCGTLNEERLSIIWYIIAHLIALTGYLAYKWSKKNEAMKAQKEALEKAGKVAVLERFLEDNKLDEMELEELKDLFQTQPVKPVKPARNTIGDLVPNPDPPIQNATAWDKLNRKLEDIQKRIP